jgi:hypothetical protein
VLERFEHRSHFLADIPGAVAMDQSGDAAHGWISYS